MKNTNRSKRIIGGLMVAAILFMGVEMQAQQQRAVKKMRFENRTERIGVQRGIAFCENLNLTEAQQAKITDLRLKHQKKKLQIRNLIDEKRARLQTLRLADNFDQKAINKIIDDMTKLKAKNMKQGIAHQQEVRTLLTEEQRMIFDLQKQNRRHNKGIHRGQRMGHKR